MSDTPKPIRREMTEYEAEAVKCLGQVRYLPCSWDKRFARSLSGLTTITDREAPQVWRLFKRYRRQIEHPDKARLLVLAEARSAPDFRKEALRIEKAQRVKEERDKYERAMQERRLESL